MIGLGLEVIDVVSFAVQLDEPSGRLPWAAFSSAEQAEVGLAEPSRSRRLAARGAAKLAFLKALQASDSTAESLLGAPHLSEIEIMKAESGQPVLQLSGKVAEVASACLGSEWVALLSLTHEGDTAAAVVVLERLVTL